MNKKITISLCFVLLLFSTWTFSQESYNENEGFEGKNLSSMHANTDWYKLMQVAEPNIHDVQKAYDNYFQTNKFVKSKETRAFEFWKKHVAADNYDQNGFVGKQITNEDDVLLIYKQRSGMQKVAGQSAGAANWSRINMKPDMLPSWQSGSYTQGTCNMLAIHPTDTTQMIAAFIDGGTLWRTTDNCATWTQVATNLMVRHFGAVVYCKSNPLVVYAGSKQGVIKSIDGGATWTICSGFNKTADYPTGSEIWAMEVKADDPNTVICATGATLYKTTNGGTSWTTSALGTNIRDLRALPGDPNVLFATFKTASWAELRRSTNFGTTWATVVGYPSSVAGYTGELAMVAVSPAEPNSVWAELIAKETATGVAKTYAIYKSTDGGLNFTNTGITQDLTDKFWQGGWNQAFAVSDVDTKIMAGGAYSTFVTKDGGLTWNADGSMGKNGPHSDVHGIVIRGRTVWMVGDGGITKTYNYGKAGTYIHDVDDGIQSHCLWGFDQAWKSDIMAVGMYHGPTTIRDDATYVGWYPGPGADASDAFVNKGDDRYIYAHPWGNTRITRSTSRMTPPSNIGITYVSNGNNDMNDPDYYEKLYGMSGSKIMLSGNNATSFTDSIAFKSNISDYVVALTNNKIVYARAGNTISKSADGGATWVDITPKTIMGSQSLSHIAIDGANPQVIWATFGNKQSAIKVAKSTNGGTTWVNYSGVGLPSYSVNCVIGQMGTNGGVYIGTDAGVYYRDNTMNSWTAYNTNLPLTTHVAWIKINYAKAKLRIAGQTGIWESDLFSPSAPVAHPTTPYFESQVGKTFQFADMSVALANATYEWTFPTGVPASSTEERPSVSFTTGGDKNITLKVTDANGTDTRTYNAFVRVRSTENVAVTGWKVIYFDSQYNATTNAAANIIDGKTNTIWVSKGSGTTKYPHDIQVDMGSEVSIGAFKYTPRQDGSTLGRVKDCEWYVSNDGVNWGTAVATGSYDATESVKTTTLSTPCTARYFRFRPLSANDGTGFATASELGVVGTYGVISSFSANKTMVKPGSTVTFTDNSAGNPTSWSWSFPGGTPSTSTEQHPVVTYNTEGIYPVTLSVSNAVGSDVITKSSYITATAYVPRTGWSVKYVDSQESVSEKSPATNVFDGSTSTYWGTDYSSTNPACPHEIQIDMGANYTISGFSYLPRQDNPNGRIAKYEFYVSVDGTNWTLTNSGTWPNSTTEQAPNFTQNYTVRYVRLKALSEVNGNKWTTVAELKVKIAYEPSTGIKDQTISEKVSIYSYQNEVKVDFNEFAKAKVQVFDIMGRQLLETQINKGLNSIALNTSGIFIVKVMVGNNVISRKVILE